MKKFEEIYAKYQKKVYNTFKQKLNNDKETAEDLTITVFVKINKHLQNFNPELSNFDTWVYNITKNVLIDYFRSKEFNTKRRFVNAANMENDLELSYLNKYQTEKRQSNGKELYDSLDSVESDSNMLCEEINALIQKTLGTLKEINQKVCKLQMDGFQMNEISEALNIPEGTVKVYVHRFRNLLKEKLENRSYCLN